MLTLLILMGLVGGCGVAERRALRADIAETSAGIYGSHRAVAYLACYDSGVRSQLRAGHEGKPAVSTEFAGDIWLERAYHRGISDARRSKGWAPSNLVDPVLFDAAPPHVWPTVVASDFRLRVATTDE